MIDKEKILSDLYEYLKYAESLSNKELRAAIRLAIERYIININNGHFDIPRKECKLLDKDKLIKYLNGEIEHGCRAAKYGKEHVLDSVIEGKFDLTLDFSAVTELVKSFDIKPEVCLYTPDNHYTAYETSCGNELLIRKFKAFGDKSRNRKLL